MYAEVKIHPGYAEHEQVMKEIVKKAPGMLINPLPRHFGKYQWFFSSDKGEICLIEILDTFNGGNNGEDYWEIYCMKGGLFEDTIRFSSFSEAKKQCQEFLG